MPLVNSLKSKMAEIEPWVFFKAPRMKEESETRKNNLSACAIRAWFVPFKGRTSLCTRKTGNRPLNGAHIIAYYERKRYFGGTLKVKSYVPIFC